MYNHNSSINSSEKGNQGYQKLYRMCKVLSLFYIGIMCFYAFMYTSSFNLNNPNEIGDFLAGVFAPLAFLWLILGFFQQGNEMRQNSLALMLQADELNNSVEQYQELVKATQDQVENDKKAIRYQRWEVKKDAILRLSHCLTEAIDSAEIAVAHIHRERGEEHDGIANRKKNPDNFRNLEDQIRSSIHVYPHLLTDVIVNKIKEFKSEEDRIRHDSDVGALDIMDAYNESINIKRKLLEQLTEHVKAGEKLHG